MRPEVPGPQPLRLLTTDNLQSMENRRQDSIHVYHGWSLEAEQPLFLTKLADNNLMNSWQLGLELVTKAS